MPKNPFGRRRIAGEARTATPLYHQVYVALRQRIRDGAFDGDHPLPGENQLAREFGVARVTVRKALAHLELDGFITKRCGVGSFPVPQPVEFRDRYNAGGLRGAPAGHAPAMTMATLSIDTLAAPGPVARKLAPHGPPGEVLRLIRVRSVDGQPFTLMTAYIAAEYAADLDDDTLRTVAPPVALEAKGISMDRAEQAIGAVTADGESARLLAVTPGTPLIRIDTTFYDERERPAMVIESLYRPDLYEYRSTVRRDASGRWQSVF